MLNPESHCTILAAKTVLPSPNRFDYSNALRDEDVTHRILDHLILLFILGLRDRFPLTTPNRSFESTKDLSEQEVQNRQK